MVLDRGRGAVLAATAIGVVLAFSCRRFGDAEGAPGTPDADADAATAPDGATARCTGRYGAPLPVAGLDDRNIFSSRFSDDELEVVFQGVEGSTARIFVARRLTRETAFGTAVPVALSNAPGTTDGNPALSSDRREIFFTSNRPGSAAFDIYHATRQDADAGFDAPTKVAELSTPQNESEPFLSADGSELWFTRGEVIGTDTNLWHARRDQTGFVDLQPTAELNSGAFERAALLRADGLALYFASGRNDAGMVPWIATRTAIGGPFSKPEPVADLPPVGQDAIPMWLSLDGCRLYLAIGNSQTVLRVVERGP